MKRLLQRIGKKNFGECWLASPIANHRLTVNESIPNIDKHNKTNFIFFRICLALRALVVCCLMMARCSVDSMILGYHEYISKLSLESELDLLKYSNIDILTSILMQNKLKHTHVDACASCYKKLGNWQKSWRIVVIRQIRQSFFPSKVFYCMVHMYVQ